MNAPRALRLVRLSLGAVLCAAWAAIWAVLAFSGLEWFVLVIGFLATPLLLWGLPLLVSGLPRRPDPTARLGAARLLLKVSSYAVAAGYGLVSLLFVPGLETGDGSEVWLAAFVGTAAVCVLSGKRVGR